MKLLNNILYLELEDAISCGLGSANYITKERSRGAKWARFIDDPEDLRRMLIEYESLRPGKKEQVQRKFGNVYERIAKEPIRKLIKQDIKANDFFLQYRFDGEKSLSIEHVQKYTAAANWLNMLSEIGEDKKALKKLLNLSIGEFWLQVCEIITSDDIDLPKSYRRLTEKIRQYKIEGYDCLIHKQFGNQKAQKVNSELAEAVLLQMIGNGNQFDDVYIAHRYNEWANENNHKTITAGTVGNWRRKNEYQIISQREGNSAFNEKYIREVKGLKPSAPLVLVESDDYWLNYLYAGEDEKGKKNNFKRYISYVVADSFNGLVLGKSYVQSGGPIVEMVRMAYIDAMYYIRSMTGSWYLPFEIKTDRWGEGSLFDWFKSIANFIEPARGNKHRGYIEQLFGSPHAKRCEKIGGYNYNGNNMTAKNIGVNVDNLKLSVSERPRVGGEAESQIEAFFYNMQNMPDVKRTDMNAPSKRAQWMAAWKELRDEQKRPISDTVFLQLFGITHEPQGRPITITNRGVEPQINGIKYSYDLPDYNTMIRYIGTKVFVIYDPYDMSRVLITNGQDIRFIAKEARLSPRALEDTTIGSRSYLNEILNSKRSLVKSTGDAALQRKRLFENDYSAETVLRMGYAVKEVKNSAEQMLIENRNADYNPLDDM